MEPQVSVERAAQSILVVESDEEIRSILDLSLRHAGYAVGLASSAAEAVDRLAEAPDLVIATASDPDALDLCRLAKQTSEGEAPAVVLISEPGLESKRRGLDAGADDFVIKPIYVQEVVARARAVLQRRERERLERSAVGALSPAQGQPRSPAGFVGDVADVPLVDLMRAIAAHQRSGVATLTADSGARGEIFFRQGNVVDAEVGRLSGRDAVYRLFCWTTGRLEVEWKSIRRKDTVEMRPNDLLMEALRRVDDWRHLLRGLPPLSTVPQVDFRCLAERLADIPDEVNKLLRLCDGVRTIEKVIDDCGLPDLDAAAAMGKLFRERIVHDARLSPASDEVPGGADMEGWLQDASGPFRSRPRVERDLFGSPAGLAAGVHGRPTIPVDATGEGTSDGPTIDDEMRARFTDRLAAEAEPRSDSPGATETAMADAANESADATDDESSALLASYPKTLLGLPAVTPPPGHEVRALDRSEADAVKAGAMGVLTSQVNVDAPPRGERVGDDAAPSSQASRSLDDIPTAEIRPIVSGSGAALPLIADSLSASGEIVVRAERVNANDSPAAELRLAHLREEGARVSVRPSQSMTPAGSARSLDEPPPLSVSGGPDSWVATSAAGEQPSTGSSLIASPPTRHRPPPTTGQTDEFPIADAAAELGFYRGRRFALLGALAVVLLVGGAVALRLDRTDDSGDSPGDTTDNRAVTGTNAPSAAQPGIPLPAAPSSSPGTPPPAQHTALPSLPAKAGDRPTAEAIAPVAVSDRYADPKLARSVSEDAAVYLAACHQAFQEQRMKDAEAACTAARDANPDSAEAQGWLAHALFNRNRRTEALAAAERAVKLDPKWADAYVIIGGVHQDTGQIEEAKRAYQRYLELDPHGPYAGDLQTIVDRLGKR
jgi:CheY-like chemotaxis protein/TolA-binding protein